MFPALFHILLGKLALGTIVVTMESVEVPGQQPYTPTASTEGLYDVPTGVTFKVKCTSDGGIPLISTPTRPLLAVSISRPKSSHLHCSFSLEWLCFKHVF